MTCGPRARTMAGLGGAATGALAGTKSTRNAAMRGTMEPRANKR
jgi:hypothetical protein